MGLTQITTGGVDDNINIDSNTLKVDGTNNRVGIGTTTPNQLLTLGSDTGNATIGLDFETSTTSRGSILYNAAVGEMSLTSGYSGYGGRIVFDCNGSERLRIDSSGRVGIGLTPHTGSGYALQVDGGASSFLQFFNDTTGETINDGLVIGNDSNTAYIVNKENTPLTFRTNNTERMRIDSSGRVGIGITNPGSFYVSGDDLVVGGTGAHGITIKTGSANQGILAFADGTSGGTQQYAGYILYDHSLDDLFFATGATERMRIDSSGNVAIGTTSIDRQFHVQGGGVAGTQVQIEGTIDSAGIKFVPASGADQYEIQATDNSALIFYNRTDTAERMRLNSSGSLQIGGSANTGSQLLQVQGGSNSTADVIICNSVASTGQQAQITFAPANNITGARIITTAEEDFSIGANRTARMEFHTRKDGSLTEKMRVSTGGQLLIGGTATGGNNTKLRVFGDEQQFYNSSSPDAVQKRAISTIYTNLSTTATAMSQGLINNACVVDVFLENIDADQGVFRFTSGRRNGEAHKYSLVSGSNSNCSVSLSTNVFTITGLGDGRTYTLTMSTGSIGTAPTLKASSTATGTTKLAMYSVGAF